MPYRSPEQARAASRRYYSGKGRHRRHQRYIEQRGERAAPINPAPLERALQNWKTR